MADSTANIANQLLNGDAVQKAATYHLVASGEATWHGYASKIVELANQLGVNTKVKAAYI